MTYHYIPATVE